MAADGGLLFTLDAWKNWEKTGKTEVTETIKELLKEGNENPGLSTPGQTKDLSRALYELVSAVVKGHLRKDHAVPLLTDIMYWHPDIASQLVEVVALLDLEILASEKMSKMRDNLLTLVKHLDADRLLKERLEIETLGDAAIVRHKKIFHTKQIKVKTKLFYKQQKFNLLREEAEGYAKLVTELNQDLTDDRVTPESMIQVIRSLIGGFNLDPNRVLDLILESLESRPQHHVFYTNLLSLYPCESATISEILGFKLNSAGGGGEGEGGSIKKETQGIYTTSALLIQAGILHLQDIYVWLTPEDSSMIEEHKREVAEAHEIAQRLHVVSTKDKDKDKEKEEELREKQEQQRSPDQYLANEKVQLCVALLKVGAWEHFLEVSRKFPDNYLVSFPPISSALCSFIHSLIEPLYRRICNLPSLLQGPPVKPLDNPRAPQPATNISELISVVFPMLSALGPHLHRDPGLIYKVLRIARHMLRSRQEGSGASVGSRSNGGITGGGGEGARGVLYYEFLDILDEVLLPSLSMLDANPCLAEEIWDTIKIYPYQHRYKLYGRWKNETCQQHSSLLRKRTALLKKAKFIMMRITKETIKPVSRGIGKLTHNNPGPIFEYILMQVQLYDNLIGPVVDSFKYLTSLSYDVLGYCIVEILSENRDRTANDGMAISLWLQSLSSFTGSVYKKYPIDLGGILQFVANQLKVEKSIDLLILREIVQKMGGTDTLEDLTAEQLSAMCGGELLRREAGQYLQERNTKRSSVRLKDALLEHGLAVPLLLLIAQQRAAVIFKQTESPHLKLIGKLYDQCQDTMVQFGSYLFQAVTIDELSAHMPSIATLLSDHHVSADVAFFLTRPLFVHKLNAKCDELRKDKGDRKLSLEQRKIRYLEACGEVLSPIVPTIRPYISTKVFEDMDPSFFLTFWTLTMSDLEVPHHMYEKEIKKIDPAPSSCSKRKKEADRLLALKEKLQEEEKKQKEHVERVMARLELEKRRWFTLRGARSPKTDTVTAFLQLCLFPRCTFTTLDAMYCAKFVKMLHDLKTPNFSTLICYDRMYCDITYTVASCTEQEAHRYARFLLGTLDTVMHWHSSEANYERECSTYPGFVTKYRVSRQEANDYVDYENYRHLVHKWHYKITKALITCVESGDYIQIRNSILILQGIIQRFPAIHNLASVIVKRIEKVKAQERNVRNDLYVLINSYSGQLKAIKPRLPQEPEFHIIMKRPSKHGPVITTINNSSSSNNTLSNNAASATTIAAAAAATTTTSITALTTTTSTTSATTIATTTNTTTTASTTITTTSTNASVHNSNAIGVSDSSGGGDEKEVEESDSGNDDDSVKLEGIEVANGDLMGKAKVERETWENEETSKSSERKGGGGEEQEPRRYEDKKREEKEKKREKEKEEKEEKSRKRSKESKKMKVEQEEYLDAEERERDREREGSVTSNTSSSSNRMERPEPSPRSSKRRKTDHSSKSRSSKEEGTGASSSSRHKHKGRSKPREVPPDTVEESKREKKERKRERSQDDTLDGEQKRKKAGGGSGGSERAKSNGRQEDDHKHRYHGETDDYYERYQSKETHKEYEYEREYEKPNTRHKRKN